MIVMHNRAEPTYTDLVAEIVADLESGDRAGRPARLSRASR